MKHVYVLATAAVLSMMTLGNKASAQNYTAVRDGGWSIGSGNGTPWDPNGKPPSPCNNCTIIVNSGVKLTLDVHITLTGNSILQVGTDEATTAQLFIVGSGATGFTSSHNIILSSAGTDNTRLRVLSNSFVDASGARTWDGIFAENGSFLKQVGTTPWTIFAADGTPELTTTVQGGSFLNGPASMSGSGPLPVTLETFTAVANNGAVDLSWTTAQESNSDHILIERSINGGADWKTLGTVNAAGSSALPTNYSFVDESPVAGSNDYRLQFVDRDGKSAYSYIKVVRSGVIATLNIFPNPATDVVNVSISSNEALGMVSVRLMTQSGQLLTEKKLENAAGTTVSLPVGMYPQGNYLILVTGPDGSRQVNKVVISRQ